MAERPLVLLVDDEPHVLAALRRTLRREGLEIETVGTPTEALERLARPPSVDLVISDQKMPGRTGVELLQEIRRLSPGTARILLSGWSADIDPTALDAAGCSAVVSKPWDDAELKQQIREALAGG